MIDFEAIARTSEQLEEKWAEKKVSVLNKNSFTGIQQELKTMRRFLQNEKAERDKLFSQMASEKVYDPSHIDSRRRVLDAEFQKTKENVIESAKVDIRALIEFKLKKLDKMLVSVPSKEQITLLEVLKLRNGNISLGELRKMLPFFYSNYQSMRIFETIAAAAGHHIETPISDDVMDMYGELDRAGDYLLQAADALKDLSKINGGRYGAFYYEDKSGGNADITYWRFVELFDRAAQLQEYKISTALSEAEQTQVNHYFKELDGLNPSNAADNITILRITDKIMREHPDDISLLKRSQWGKYVREIEELNSAKEKVIEVATDGQAQTVGK